MISIFILGIGIIGYYVILYFLIERTLTLFQMKRKWLCLILGLFIFSFPIFCIIDYLNRGIKFIELGSIIGYIITGFLIYYIFSLFVSLGVRIIWKKIKKEKYPVYDKITIMISAISSIIICLAGMILAQAPERTYLEFDIEGNHSLKAVILSDIHYGSTGSLLSLERMVEHINQEKADVVFLVGDVFDNYVENLDHTHFIKEMNKIESKWGVYAITGNHEFMFNSLEEIKDFYEGTNITLLLDEELIIDNISIVGRIDHRHSRKELADIKKDSELPLIVLDHQPQFFREAKNNSAFLQISGHTHNGQIFPGNLVVALYNQILYQSPSNGIHQYEDFTLAITRGYGTWGFPMRLSGASQMLIYNFI